MRDKLDLLSKKAINIKPQLKSEEATKHSIIIPFLTILGYDMSDPLEVIPEYTADFGTNSGEKVDYAIMKDGRPVILIECKHCTESLERHKGQLFKYYSALSLNIPGKKIAILTNGYQFQLYTDLENPSHSDKKPFFAFDITQINDGVVDTLSKLHKQNLNLNEMVNSATELRYSKELENVLYSDLTNPSLEFISYLAKKVYGKAVTKSKTTLLASMLDNSIKNVIKQIAPVDYTPEPDNETIAEKSGTHLTEEETNIFNAVRAILCDIIPMDRVSYDDYASVFNIILDGKWTKTFFKMKKNTRQKGFTLVNADKTKAFHEYNSIENIHTNKNDIIKAAKSYID